MRMSYMILQRRVGTLREEKLNASTCIVLIPLVKKHMLKSFQTSGVRLVGMISRIASALVEPAPVVVEADSLAIEVDRFLNLLKKDYQVGVVVMLEFAARMLNELLEC
ncbi:hypothetical protein Tco_1133923 [Tanacetum coccineum]